MCKQIRIFEREIHPRKTRKLCRSTPSCVVCAPIAAGEDRFGTSGAFGGRTGPVRLGMIRLGADFEGANAVKCPSLESAFSFTFGCLCLRCVVSGGGG